MIPVVSTLEQSSQPAKGAAESPLRVGDVVAGKYRIEGLLGVGSFAWVFRAGHLEIPTLQLAVKVLKAEHTQDASLVRRFRREAETAAVLQSAHVVKVSDVGKLDDGVPFIVMEFIDGVALDDLLKREGRLDEETVAIVAVQALSALREAHEIGIVHRDLKPANIYLIEDPDGERLTKVIDFGIAKILDTAEGVLDATATSTGHMYCTPRYAAPELLRGNPGPQSDIYALGILLAELLEGKPPYEDENFYAAAAQHLKKSPVPLSARVMDSRLSTLIERAVSKDTEIRYRTAGEMYVDARTALASIRGGGAPQQTGGSVESDNSREDGPRLSGEVDPPGGSGIDDALRQLADVDADESVGVFASYGADLVDDGNTDTTGTVDDEAEAASVSSAPPGDVRPQATRAPMAVAAILVVGVVVAVAATRSPRGDAVTSTGPPAVEVELDGASQEPAEPEPTVVDASPAVASASERVATATERGRIVVSRIDLTSNVPAVQGDDGARGRERVDDARERDDEPGDDVSPFGSIQRIGR